MTDEKRRMKGEDGVFSQGKELGAFVKEGEDSSVRRAEGVDEG